MTQRELTYLEWRQKRRNIRYKDIKIRACFMQNFMDLGMRKSLDPKAVTFGVWGLITSFGQFEPKRRI